MDSLDIYEEAMQCKNQGDTDKAIRLLNLALSIRDEPLFHWQLAYILMEESKFKEAESHFKYAIHLEPDCVPALGGLGRLYAQMGLLELAETAVRKRLSLRSSPNQYIFLADILNRKKDFLGALDACQRAVSLNPSNEGYLNLGITLRKLGRFCEAVAAFEQAVLLDPDDARSISELGLIYFAQQKIDLAESKFLLAIKLDDSYNCARVYLANLYVYKGDRDKALRTFEEAITIDANDDFVLLEYKRFLGVT